jgi:hypothetical protein
MLSAAKHLAADRDKPFAEFTLSEAKGGGVTRGDGSNWHVLFFTLNLALKAKHDKRFQEFSATLQVANQWARREKKVYLSSYIYL